MASAILVNPIAFGSTAGTKDNGLIESMHVSNAKADMDRGQVCTLVKEMSAFLRGECGVRAVVIDQAREPKPYRTPLEDLGESVCVADSLTLHDVVNEHGAIERRLVVFYPMSPLRQGELARQQLVNQITKVAETSATVELIDLRPFEEEGRYLEGAGSLVFSPGSEFVYMALTQRSHPAVLDALCRPENLNIPPQNRFLLHCRSGVPHTNVLGWCGAGICAWAADSLAFDSEEAEDAFYHHLGTAYRCVLELSETEMTSFAGSALEVPVQRTGGSAGSTCSVLMMSDTALASLSPKNRAALMDWYGEENVHTFYGQVLERRCGTSLPSCISKSYTIGPHQPLPTQPSTVEVLQLDAGK